MVLLRENTYQGNLNSTNQKELNDIKQAINDLTNMIEGKHMRLEAILSQIIEREMITQDSYDKVMNLLIEFGKKKGWTK